MFDSVRVKHVEDNLKKESKPIVYEDVEDVVDCDNIEALRRVKLKDDKIKFYQRRIINLVQRSSPKSDPD